MPTERPSRRAVLAGACLGAAATVAGAVGWSELATGEDVLPPYSGFSGLVGETFTARAHDGTRGQLLLTEATALTASAAVPGSGQGYSLIFTGGGDAAAGLLRLSHPRVGTHTLFASPVGMTPGVLQVIVNHWRPTALGIKEAGGQRG